MDDIQKFISLENLDLYNQKSTALMDEKDDAVLAAAKKYSDDLAVNYDTAGSAGTALENANKYTDEKIGTIPEGYTQETVIAYINKKAEETLSAAQGGSSETAASVKLALETYQAENDPKVQALETDVATIKGDYLKGADKTELEDKISAKATQTALQDEIDRAKDEESRIEGLVTEEADRAAGVEADLDERLVEVEAFFKLADGEQLDAALDTLKEIQIYITSEGSAADQMVLDIAANAKAIEDMDAAYKAADAVLKSELDDDIASAIADVKTDSSNKDAAVLAEAQKGIAAVQTALDEAVDALGGADTVINGRLDALEGKFTGEDSVEDMIADVSDRVLAIETWRSNFVEASEDDINELFA